jgi:hypothetical protein
MTIKEIKEFCKDKGYKKLMLGGRMSYGCYPTTDLNKIKTSWDKQPKIISNLFVGCYSGYFSKNKGLIEKTDWKYYVSYPSMPEWFPELVKEFNKFYDNLNRI